MHKSLGLCVLFGMLGCTMCWGGELERLQAFKKDAMETLGKAWQEQGMEKLKKASDAFQSDLNYLFKEFDPKSLGTGLPLGEILNILARKDKGATHAKYLQEYLGWLVDITLRQASRDRGMVLPLADAYEKYGEVFTQLANKYKGDPLITPLLRPFFDINGQPLFLKLVEIPKVPFHYDKLSKTFESFKQIDKADGNEVSKYQDLFLEDLRALQTTLAPYEVFLKAVEVIDFPTPERLKIIVGNQEPDAKLHDERETRKLLEDFATALKQLSVS